MKLFLLIVVLTIFSTGTFAQDTKGIQKIDFERRTGIVVWDSGSTLGTIDEGDRFTDTNDRCVFSGADAETLKYDEAIKRYRASSTRLPLDLTVLKRTPLDETTFKELLNRTVETYDSRDLNRPLFILFPETHAKGMITLAEDPYQHAYELHRSQANFMFDLMKAMQAKGLPLLNLVEGPYKPLRDAHDTFDWRKMPDERYIRSVIWNNSNSENGTMVMAGLFSDIPSFAVEDLALYLDGAIKVRAYFNPEPTSRDSIELSYFENTISPHRAFSAIADDEKLLNEMREMFKNLNDQQRAEIVNNSCEDRSRNMVTNSLKLNQNKKGDTVIFLRFGAAHSKSIIDSIKLNNSSFILISP